MSTSSIQARLASARSAVADRWRTLRASLAPHRAWIWLGVFSLICCWQYSDPNQLRSHAAVAEAHGDGFYYYAYLRSLWFDHDVDFTNDYRLPALADQFHAGVNPITKRPQNVFTPGPALFWMPMVPVAKLAQPLAEKLGAPHVPKLDGTEYDFQRIVLFASVLAGLVTVGLGILLALELTEASLAAIAGIGLCLGSPLIWFMLRQPSFSHATQACAVALFASFWVYRYGSRTPWHWALMGALLGLAMDVRPQDVAHGLLPFVEWCIVLVQLVRERKPVGQWFRNAFLLLGCTIITFSPLMLIWRAIYGAWTLVPQGSGFMDWGNSRWDATLFTSRSGLFAWHPLLLLSFCGLIALALWRSQPAKYRLLAALAIVVLFAQSYINGSAKDWWGGWAFGGRRFSGCTLYFMVGFASVLEGGRRLIARNPLRVAQLASLGLVLVFALYNRSMADDYTFFRLWLDKPQPMKRGIAAALAKTLDETYGYTGNPGSWPMNLIYAWRIGGSPESYDTVAAADMDAAPYPQTMKLDEFHAAAGFEPEKQYQNRTVRIARGTKAAWAFAVRVSVEASGIARLAASRPGLRVRMSAGGTTFFDHRLGSTFREYPFKLPPAATSAGVVVVNVEQGVQRPGDFIAWDDMTLTLLDRRPPEEQPPPE
ncbi:MAG: hypothetical protein ABW352_02155 [Polyangiales bacterium]